MVHFRSCLQPRRTTDSCATTSATDPALSFLRRIALPSSPAVAPFQPLPVDLGSGRSGSIVVANETPASVAQVAQDAIKCQLSIGKQLPSLALCLLMNHVCIMSTAECEKMWILSRESETYVAVMITITVCAFGGEHNAGKGNSKQITGGWGLLVEQARTTYPPALHQVVYPNALLFFFFFFQTAVSCFRGDVSYQLAKGNIVNVFRERFVLSTVDPRQPYCR